MTWPTSPYDERGYADLNLGAHIDKLFMRLARNRRIDGLWVGVLDKDDERLLGRVEEALGLIRQYDPVRYRRLLRDLDRIWLAVLPGARASLNQEFRTCNLDWRFVGKASAEQIASSLVHEATHAHPLLKKFGYPEEIRYRIERICMRQELAFADRLPEGSAIRAEIERSLTLPPAYWLSNSLRDKHLAGARAAMRDLGAPGWLIKSVLALRTAFERLHRLNARHARS
jgi:hypothetical protein